MKPEYTQLGANDFYIREDGDIVIWLNSFEYISLKKFIKETVKEMANEQTRTTKRN